MNKIVIIGVGNVGMAYAYSLIIKGSSIDEIVFIDINKDKAMGEATDLSHAAAGLGKKIKIKAGQYDDCSNASIVCIAAGKNQNIGESRTMLVNKNIEVFRSIVGSVKDSGFRGIYLVATNPLDIMTYVTLKLSGACNEQVIGSGTTLDTARLRHILSDQLDINAKNIHAYVIGEHGDSEMIPWSNAIVGLNKATDYIDEQSRKVILDKVRNSAYKIIEQKGNTAYGIGVCLTNITMAIINNENSIFTISSYNEQDNICYGMPTVVNKSGAKQIINLSLSDQEMQELNISKQNIKNIIQEVNI